MGTSLFDQQPSAIGHMMGLLQVTPPAVQGQGPMPQVQPSQMPQMAPPPMAPAHQPRLVDRIHDRLQGLLHTVQDSTKPQEPGGYEGLLSPEEIQKAKPGFFSSLWGDAAAHPEGGAGYYRDRLDSLVKMHELASGLAEQHRIESVRKGIGAVMQGVSDPREAAAKGFQYLVQNGDLAGAKELATGRAAFLTEPKDDRFRVAGGDLIDVGDPNNPKIINQHDPRNPVMGSDEWKAAQAYLASLRQRGGSGGGTGPLVQIEGPDGTPIYATREQALGKQAKTTTHQESAMNMASKARLTAAVSEMNNAHQSMHEFEDGLANGSIKIGAPSQLLQRLANSFTHDDPASMILQSGSLAALDHADPALARYIRRGLSFAEGESMVSQRPSDYRTKMAAFLSTAASGATPDMIHDIQSRRTSILTPLNATVAPSPSRGNGSATGRAPSYEEWKKAHGH